MPSRFKIWSSPFTQREQMLSPHHRHGDLGIPEYPVAELLEMEMGHAEHIALIKVCICINIKMRYQLPTCSL